MYNYVYVIFVILTSLLVQNDDSDKKISASTFIGGASMDDAYEPSIVLDKNGNVYISGFTLSKDFPVTTESYNSKFNGGTSDRFVSKLSNDLSKLLASTYIGGKGLASPYIGGNGDELGHAVVVDAAGNIYIAGYTESPDFPVTKNSFDESYNGGRDVFVAKFDENLEHLLASTFLGGTGDEGYEWPRIGLALDKNDNVYVCGITHSVDFPTTSSAFDRTFNGGKESGDVFIAKFDNDLKNLLASSYVGGESDEWRVSIIVDEDDVLICGETQSFDFPVKEGYSQKLNTIKDVFISKFNHELSKLKASTFFGGNSLDEALSMKKSGKGEIVITGYTESLDFPTTQGVLKREWSGGKRDAYVAIFDNTLKKLIGSTLLGGSGIDMGRGIELDGHDNIYIVGSTNSSDFLSSDNQNQMVMDQTDSFFVILSPKLEKILWADSFGGSKNDVAYSIAMDKDRNVFIAGITSSEDFFTTNEAFSKKYNGGGNDGFIVKFTKDLFEFN